MKILLLATIFFIGQCSFLFAEGTLYQRKVSGKWGWYEVSDEKNDNGIWIGGIQNKKPHGTGVITYTNGNKYEGQYKDGFRHGQGTYTYPDGANYVGEFKDGLQNGQGTFTFPDGEKYVGEYKDGKKNGQGKHILSNGHMYVGMFKDNERMGQGTYTVGDGTKYVGEWKDDNLNGHGTFTWSDGNKYVGMFKDGKKNGQGTFTWSDGNKYVGEYKDDSINGKGTYFFFDGRKISGEWKDNKEFNAVSTDKNGNITYKWVNGVQKGIYFPDAQEEMIKIVMDFASQYRKKETDIRRTQTRKKRSVEISNLVGKRGSGINKWNGSIVSITTDENGNVNVIIELDYKKVNLAFGKFPKGFEGIKFRNANRIKSNSPIIDKIADLKPKDLVSFSGQFIIGEDTSALQKELRKASNENLKALKAMGIDESELGVINLGGGESLDFIKEFSFTESGSMEEPEFAVVFSDIEKL